MTQPQLTPGTRFYAAQVCCPAWWTLAILGGLALPLALWGSWQPSQPAVVAQVILPLVLLVVVPVCLAFMGGFKYVANHRGLTVSLRSLGIPLKRLNYDEITEVHVIKNFNPLQMFLGYGYRVNPARRATGFCICKGDAVEIQTADWKYVLVMPEAEGFADLIGQARQIAAR